VTQPTQKVHSKLQMKAWASLGRGESHRSQADRISSKDCPRCHGGTPCGQSARAVARGVPPEAGADELHARGQRLDPVSTKSVLTPVSPLS